MKQSKKKNKIINFYELEGVKAFFVKHHNPNYDFNTMPLKHPLQMLICGSTGSGKSNVLLNIINLMDSTFNGIKIFTQNKQEPLYEYLESVIDKPYLEIYEGLDALRKMDLEELEKAQWLFIFDDMVAEKNQKAIEHIYIRGRKLAKKGGISAIYLSQSYFQTPPIIRKQINSLILKKINGKRDISSILRETSINAESYQLLNMLNTVLLVKKILPIFYLLTLEHRMMQDLDAILMKF
jgi:ABC-type dipeptide/oligopeptide/nickel transport system ATPase component